ncbi:hypothetical protein ACOKGD_14625 [Microbacterium phosphatis]|uniref:hypothetical protein n=1 Tax=Microbacterium phosphatis TaxID=3140248 RepID=UPI003140776C
MNTSTPRRTHKRKIVAVLAGVAVAAAVSASASTLGGATAQTIGADTAPMGSVLSEGVNVAWDTAFVGDAYQVTSVTLTTNAGEKIPAGAEIKLAVLGDGAVDDALVELGKTLTAAEPAVTWSGQSIPAASITGVAVLIDGNAVDAASTTPAG